jgi:peptidoglycan hydrolase CwlO-like protein
MNDTKYTGDSEPSLSEIQLQIDNISKDIEALYYQMTETEERLRSVLAPEFPQTPSESKAIKCSISPLGEKLESIHTDLQFRIGLLRDLNSRIKL